MPVSKYFLTKAYKYKMGDFNFKTLIIILIIIAIIWVLWTYPINFAFEFGWLGTIIIVLIIIGLLWYFFGNSVSRASVTPIN